MFIRAPVRTGINAEMGQNIAERPPTIEIAPKRTTLLRRLVFVMRSRQYLQFLTVWEALVNRSQSLLINISEKVLSYIGFNRLAVAGVGAASPSCCLERC